MDLEDQYDKLYRYCYFRVRDVQTAEDLVQETFLRWLDHYPGQREREALPTLYTIARNVFLDQTRRKRNTEIQLPRELPDTAGVTLTEALEDREEVLALHRILHTLPEPYKEVFGLRVFGELPFRAIGQVFGKTEGWARVTYYRAKSRILRQWEAERDESEL